MHIHNMVQRIKDIVSSNLVLLGLGGLLTVAGTLVSCNDYVEADSATFLEGQSKTPIAIQTNLSASLQSRAVDKRFESGDVLLAYIEAGKTTNATFSSDGNSFKGLKTLTLTADADNTDGDNHADLYNYTITENGPHITETEDAGLQKLYWDDYSSTENDLRDAGAGIRLKYGYCYNGGTPSTALDQTAGTLGWTIGDQTTAEAFKKSDLLYAKTQEPVSYTHGTENVASSHGILVLPYSHAMSKVTVVVTAGKGFTKEDNFGSSELTLQHINTVCSVDAPNGKVTSETPNAVKTYKSATVSKSETVQNKATFQAIVAPGTNLTVGNLIAKIADVDGNSYDIPISVEMLEGWKTKLDEAVAPVYFEGSAQAQAKPMSRAVETISQAKGYLTQSGVHYVLNVTVNKQAITVRATLADWDKVEANANAQIVFNPDVVGKGTIATALQTGGFDVYKSSSNDAFSTKSTSLTYADNKWSYSPIIYWAGQGDNSYFRALSPAGSSTSSLAQGGDILWGTSGNTAITPRTGDVPLNFEHLMSKLCIKLETTTGDDKVNLEGAKIAISNMATTATYSIVDGTVTAGEVATTMLSEKPSGFVETVIPQTIGNDAKVTITLADNTTYSVQLNQCKLTTGDKSAVGEWTKGKDYTYTITLSKHEITFSAVVKDWVPASGSGNATLDWD